MFFFLWLVLAFGVGSVADIDLDSAMLRWMADIEIASVLPIWLILRVIYFVIGGHRRIRAALHAPSKKHRQTMAGNNRRAH
ncbi:MAG: hypothetical protein KGJ53_09040 [Alphaproteobacteria bacterium]|nr:hypothetical protein [Alphaproteobacteria bacterium]MDE2163294.1 hypothetical protein [Alphaproteobacteria bacterium]